MNDELVDSTSTGLYTWLRDEAARDAARLVVTGYYRGADLTLSLSELFRASTTLATGLQSLGVTNGQTIGLWLPNQVEWLVAQFACSALGVTILGLNTRFRSHEMSHLLATVPLSAIILPSAFLNIDFVGTLDESFKECRASDPDFSVPTLVFLDDVPAEAAVVAPHCVRYSDLVENDGHLEWRDHATVLSNLFTTSGSTSAPKVAGHDQRTILRHALAGAAALGVRPNDRILAALPLCGVFGYNSAMAVLVGGGSVLLLRSFDAREAAEHLMHSAITHVIGGDEMLGAIFAQMPEGADAPSLRRGGIANFAGHAKEVVEQADARWGAAIAGVYGSSELFALSAIWPEDAPLELRSLQGGVPVDQGIEMRVADLETGEPVADGEPGELQFRGYNVIDQYLHNEAATRAAFSEDGWFRTGDLGYRAHGGFVYQCRAREVLRLRGFLVEPAEIEDYFGAERVVDEVHVVGVDTDAGTKAIAFIRPRAGEHIDEQALLVKAKQRLASFKVPERIVEVAEFPTTTGTNGTKVRFEVLREQARQILAEAQKVDLSFPRKGGHVG